jgi:hypothetical protein
MGVEVVEANIHPPEVAGRVTDVAIARGKLAGPTTTPIPAILVLLVVLALAVGAMAAVAAAWANQVAVAVAAEPMVATQALAAVGRAG